MVNVPAPSMGGGATGERIDAVDAFARTIFLRSKQCSSLVFADAAIAVRQLHLALRHLRIEATDSDSLLNSTDSSVYTRQLIPIIEDSHFALQQLDALLDKYGSGSVASASEAEVQTRVATVSSRLMQEKTNVDLFLDTIQLHNTSTNCQGMSPQLQPNMSEASLEDIKSKVDLVAARVFSRRSANSTDDDSSRLWQEFKTELENEGFSAQVLRQHKEVLRAYIRELECVLASSGGATPTVERLLEYEAHAAPQPIQPPEVPPKIPLSDKSASPESEKYMPNMKMEHRMPDHAPPSSEITPYRPRDDSFSGPEDQSGDMSMALISTKDLVAMDTINSSFANMQLQPSHAYGSPMPPTRPQQYLAPATNGANMDLAKPPSQQYDQYGSSPRFYPPAIAYNPAQNGMAPRPAHRLAPDRFGHDIPMDAQWTKIKRSLVSPEVLEQAGVRYEARPEYVAILGRLSHDEISEYARRSAACRAARYGNQPPPQYERKAGDHHGRDSKDSKSSYNDTDDDSVLYDTSDTDYDDERSSDKGTKSYPYIVSAPSRDRSKSSPSTTVKPKSILKKTEHRVHFGPDQYEDDKNSPPRYSSDDRRRPNDRNSRRQRDGRDYNGRHRDNRRDDRHRPYDSDEHHRNNHYDRRRDERAIKKKSLGETLGAVGIGGAAVSLLSVLAHAAAGV